PKVNRSRSCSVVPISLQTRVVKSCEKSGLAEPLRIVDRAVEIVGGLVALELAIASGLLRSSEEGSDFRGAERLETAGSVKSLLDVGERFAAGDDDAGGQIHGEVEALDGGKSIAAKEQTCAHGLHAENTDFIFHKNGKDFLAKAFVVSVHG